MNLSLQPKKFVNSEHVGSYAEIELPFGKNQSSVAFKIHYIEEGTGEPLILVHSAGQSLYTWNTIFKDLANTYRVIAIDLAGHGYSDSSLYCTYSIKEQATIINVLMNKLGIKSAHFIGFSMGCAVVAAFAAANPTKVGRIVMLSPGGITSSMPTRMRMLESRALGGVASLFFTPPFVRSLLFECFLDLTGINEDMVKQYATPLENSDVRRAMRYMIYDFDESEMMAALKQIDAPVLVLLASDDKWRKPESVQPYFDVMQNASSAVIRNAGHLMHEEKPDKVFAAISTFLGDSSTKAEDNAE